MSNILPRSNIRAVLFCALIATLLILSRAWGGTVGGDFSGWYWKSEVVSPAELRAIVGEPTQIELKPRPETISEAVKLLEKQIDGFLELRFSYKTNPFGNSKLHQPSQPLGPQNFWHFMNDYVRELRARSGIRDLNIRRHREEVREGVFLDADGFTGFQKPYVDGGLVIVAPSEIKRQRSVDLRQGTTTDSGELSVDVLLDPKLYRLHKYFLYEWDYVQDNEKHSLLKPYTRPKQEGRQVTTDLSALHLRAPLDYTLLKGQSLKAKGRVRVPIMTRQEDWEIAAPLNAQGTEKAFATPWGNAKLKITEAKRSGVGNVNYRFRLEATMTEAWPKVNILWRWIGDSLLRHVRLIDEQGHGFPLSWHLFDADLMNLSKLKDAPITFQATANFSRGRLQTYNAEPVKLVWTVPLDYRELEVPFQFDNLPIS